MKKEKKPDNNKGNKQSGKAFLKKRAPIYLAIIVMFIVFVIPELTAGTIQNSIPNDLTGKEKEAFDVFLAYRGPNDSGVNAIDVLSEKIEEAYPNEKIYDQKDTVVKFSVGALGEDEYQILLDFQTKKETKLYEWHVNLATDEINAVNPDAKKILEIVDYSK